MMYEARLAYDLSSYATVEFEADTDEAAVEQAKRMHCEDSIDFSVEWDGAWNERVVHVVPIVDGKPDYTQSVAEDVLLDPDPLHEHAFTLLQACKAVREWASIMGGWEAPCWAALATAIAKCEGK
jgi:hypothetical protein